MDIVLLYVKATVVPKIPLPSTSGAKDEQDLNDRAEEASKDIVSSHVQPKTVCILSVCNYTSMNV